VGPIAGLDAVVKRIIPIIVKCVLQTKVVKLEYLTQGMQGSIIFCTIRSKNLMFVRFILSLLNFCQGRNFMSFLLLSPVYIRESDIFIWTQNIYYLSGQGIKLFCG